ncbi:MAG: squalene/phytoene synthase family protein, partial [Blastomonas sp.]|nr:squalene/phytoene synthase family protein [Blastomonas sp.]
MVTAIFTLIRRGLSSNAPAMDAPETPVSPLVTLASSYGDAQMRSWCHALFAFDAQIAGIVLQAREPMLAQIRLQWWHDVIGKPAAGRPSANPVLAALLPIEADGLDLKAALGPVIRGWEAALEIDQPDAVQEFASGRGALIAAFQPLAPDVSRDDLAQIGTAWALWDMVRFHRRTAALDAAVAATKVAALKPLSLPRKLRPISIIARAVRLDIARGGMERPWGSPGVFLGL